MRRDYVWRLKGKQWQKVTRLDMGTQANTTLTTLDAVVTWYTVLKDGPVVR